MGLGIAALAFTTSACAVFAPDPVRDAQLACERKKDGSACFLAANAAAEKAEGEITGEALRLYKRGCAARNSPSCEVLSSIKGPLREQALVDACNGGDLVSCARRANEFPSDAGGLDEARALRHAACRLSTNVRQGTSAREIEGIAESCAALAKMVASGMGGPGDPIAASKLDVLAAALRLEALYQYERAEDRKALPRHAEPDLSPPRRGVRKVPKEDPTIAERARFRREFDARRASREAWMASVDSLAVAMQKATTSTDPTMASLTPLERATAAANAGFVPGASRCQACVDGCGTLDRCTGDDFAGGHCLSLRNNNPTAGSAFDACVAQCAAKVDACAKKCGECAAPPDPAAPSKSKGSKP